MAETESEKMVKDTLSGMVHKGLLIDRQKITTPRYQKEPIDFIALDSSSRTHYIECKGAARSSIRPSDFKEHQAEILSHDAVNQEDSHTRAWIVSHFYRDDVNKNHTNYFEHYFLCPGYYSSIEESVTVSNMRGNDECKYLGGYEMGEKRMIDEEYGVSTKGNQTEGLPMLEVITEC